MKWSLDNGYVTVAAFLLAIPFIWLYISINALNTDSDFDHEMRNLISVIKQNDTKIAVYLLRSRSHIDNNFDKLAEAQTKINKTMFAFNKQLMKLNEEEKKQGKIVYVSYENRANKLERFKTLHAKLNNSLRFLPKLGKKMRATFDKDESANNNEIMELVGTILTSTYSLRLFGDDSMLVNVYDRIFSLKRLKPQERITSFTELLPSFIRHAEMFLLFSQKEAEVVKLILDNHFGSELSKLEEKMSSRQLLEYKEGAKIRLYLIGYSIFLLLVILFFILNRHRLLKKVSAHQMLSKIDQLTGLSNRRHFIDKLEGLLSAVVLKPMCGAIIFIDLDGFKAVNDNLGHNAGDEILQRLSIRLRNQSLSNIENGLDHFVARLGGDEFVILLGSLNKNGITETLNKVVEQTLLLCSKSFGKKYEELPITASLGVVTFSDQSKSVIELLHFADTAMYQSKKRGKNCCSFHSDTP